MKDLDSGVHIFVSLFRCILFKFLPRNREITELSYKGCILVIMTARAFSVILPEKLELGGASVNYRL